MPLWCFLLCFPRRLLSTYQEGGSDYLLSAQEAHSYSCCCSLRGCFSCCREICRVCWRLCYGYDRRNKEPKERISLIMMVQSVRTYMASGMATPYLEGKAINLYAWPLCVWFPFDHDKMPQENKLPGSTPLYMSRLSSEWLHKPLSYLMNKSDKLSHLLKDSSDTFRVKEMNSSP